MQIHNPSAYMCKNKILVYCFIIIVAIYCYVNFNGVYGGYKDKEYSCLNRIGTRKNVDYDSSICEHETGKRGNEQKVVGFSFYEHGSQAKDMRIMEKQQNNNITQPKFFEGIYTNLKQVKESYPGWTFRLYTDLSDEDPLMDTLCELQGQHDILDVCLVSNRSTMFPMIWRFLPTLDNKVDFYISRDLDSKITDREVLAVNEWIESGKAIHAMRDHIWHRVALMGGLWGANLKQQEIRDKWVNSWIDIYADKLSYTSRTTKGQDQDVIRKHVWPWGANHSFQHDSYNCERFPGSVGFPSQRKKNETYNFVGARLYGTNTYDGERSRLTEKCPSKCRRQMDWEFC